jgi:cardiolipin synthase
MLTTWNTEEVFFDGDLFFNRLIKDIDEAQSYITIEVYMFSDDLLGRKFAAHLIAAHQRGVKIQIVVDGVGSHGFSDKLQSLFLKKGIVVKIYNPLPLYHPYYGNLTHWRKLQIFSIRVLRLNKRNHRKIYTIDGNILYTGSFNVTAEHTRYHHEKAWKDMGVRVTGENVSFAILNFKKIWKLRDYYRYKKQTKHQLRVHWKSFPLRLNHTVFMRRYYYKHFLNRIQQAEQRIWLTTPYFIPKRRLIRALGKAAKRGVDVRLLISLKNDVKLFRTLQYFYYSYLLNKGVKVYHYTDTVLHAKNYIIDDWISIGSSNLNHRSFMHDLEVDLTLQDEKNMNLVENNFLESLQEENSISLESLNQRPFLDRFLCRLFFIFKYWF